MITLKYTRLFCTFCLLMLLAACFNSSSPKINALKKKSGTTHETYGYWFFTKDKDKCYIFSFPISSYGDYLNRNLHYIMINQKGETLIYGGRKYKKDSKVRLAITNVSIFFETVGQEAWTSDDKFVISKFSNNPNSSFFIFSQLGYENPESPEDNNTNMNEAITPEITTPLPQGDTDTTIPPSTKNQIKDNNKETVDKYALEGFLPAFQSMSNQCNPEK